MEWKKMLPLIILGVAILLIGWFARGMFSPAVVYREKSDSTKLILLKDSLRRERIINRKFHDSLSRSFIKLTFVIDSLKAKIEKRNKFLNGQINKISDTDLVRLKRIQDSIRAAEGF